MNKIKQITRGQAILFLLVLLVVFGIYIGIKVANTTSIEGYKSFEKELEDAAKIYVELEDLIIDEDEEERISISKLDNEGLVNNDLKNKCKGYVLVENTEDYESEEYEITYTGNISCGNKYKTSTYVEE